MMRKASSISEIDELAKAKPSEGTKCKRFKKLLYNKEEKKCCNRNRKNWGLFIFYYVIFLFVVLSLFYVTWLGIERSIGLFNEEVYIEKDYSFDVPVITLKPIRTNKNAPEPVVWYTRFGTNSHLNRRSDAYNEEIEEFFQKQEIICRKIKKWPCPFNRKDLGPCGVKPFGYDVDEPCLYIKMNVQAGWFPKGYSEVPNNIPRSLKPYIRPKQEGVWVNCKGGTVYDDDHIGKISYFPSQKFPAGYFPFAKGLNPNPIIAIQLSHIDPGYVLHLACRVYTGVMERRPPDADMYIFIDLK